MTQGKKSYLYIATNMEILNVFLAPDFLVKTSPQGR